MTTEEFAFSFYRLGVKISNKSVLPKIHITAAACPEKGITKVQQTFLKIKSSRAEERQKNKQEI